MIVNLEEANPSIITPSDPATDFAKWGVRKFFASNPIKPSEEISKSKTKVAGEIPLDTSFVSVARD